MPVGPLLAVEVLSPSTAINDFNNKKAACARMGTSSYRVLDPAEPGALTAFELDERGCYVDLARGQRGAVFVAEPPLPVQVCPARLLDGMRPTRCRRTAGAPDATWATTSSGCGTEAERLDDEPALGRRPHTVKPPHRETPTP